MVAIFVWLVLKPEGSRLCLVFVVWICCCVLLTLGVGNFRMGKHWVYWKGEVKWQRGYNVSGRVPIRLGLKHYQDSAWEEKVVGCQGKNGMAGIGENGLGLSSLFPPRPTCPSRCSVVVILYSPLGLR